MRFGLLVNREIVQPLTLVAATDLGKRLVAALAALKRLAFLVRRELGFAAELDAARLGAVP